MVYQLAVKLLPFDGDAYGVFAFVESVLLVNEAQGNERLSLTQRLMTNPMVRSASADLVATQDEAVSRYTAESASEMLEPEQRRTATAKASCHRNLRDDIARVSGSPDEFILVVTQPLQNFPVLGALDATARPIPRDDNDRDAAKRCSTLGWAFARQAAIAAGIVRKGCERPIDACAAMAVAGRLFRTPTPPAASVLRPTGSVPDVRRQTRPADEDRITTVIVKTKLHVLACDQLWAYDAIASSNAGNTDQAAYNIPHSLDANVAATWTEAFRTISVTAGTPVGAIVLADHFAITTLPAYTGPEVHVYSVEDAIVDTNAKTGTAVVRWRRADGRRAGGSQRCHADQSPPRRRVGQPPSGDHPMEPLPAAW